MSEPSTLAAELRLYLSGVATAGGGPHPGDESTLDAVTATIKYLTESLAFSDSEYLTLREEHREMKAMLLECSKLLAGSPGWSAIDELTDKLTALVARIR